jgi:hypothetical protein
MVIDEDANVGIGSTITAPEAKLHITAATDAIHDATFAMGNYQGTSRINMDIISTADSTFDMNSSGTKKIELSTSANTTNSKNIDITGSAGLSTSSSWTNTSDERIKTNVQTIENALVKINALRPVSFKYTDEYLGVHDELDKDTIYNSFIAQEYQIVFPDAVTQTGKLIKCTESIGEDGIVQCTKETLYDDLLQYTPHDLHMYLVRAVQELSAKVTALENA